MTLIRNLKITIAHFFKNWNKILESLKFFILFFSPQKYDSNGNKKKNFIQLLLEAETSDFDMSEDGFIDYSNKNLIKNLSLDVK